MIPTFGIGTSTKVCLDTFQNKRKHNYEYQAFQKNIFIRYDLLYETNVFTQCLTIHYIVLQRRAAVTDCAYGAQHCQSLNLTARQCSLSVHTVRSSSPCTFCLCIHDRSERLIMSNTFIKYIRQALEPQHMYCSTHLSLSPFTMLPFLLLRSLTCLSNDFATFVLHVLQVINLT